MSIEKIRKQYTCEKCVFCTYKLYDYNRHLATQKHLDDQIVDPNSSIECLICKQPYKTQSGLWKHKKTCKPILKNEGVITENEEHDSTELQNIYNIFKEIAESNAELKQLVINQQRVINQQIEINIFL